MERLVRSRSQNINEDGSNAIESDHDGPPSAASESGDGRNSADPVESTHEIADQVSVTQPAGNTIPIPIPTSTGVNAAAAPPPPTAIEINVVVQQPVTGQPEGQDIENQISEFGMEDMLVDLFGPELMYQAALEGDWLTAEMLLERDKTLARDAITERGDRALHVAAATNHTKFVKKLVERMNQSDLALLDGKGQTACCYAAISGNVEIADVLLKKNKKLGTVHDKNDKTPLHKAALRGKAKMVSYFLKSIEVEDLSKLDRKEWFDLLLVTIRSKMYGVALEILEKDGSLATMRDPDGCTALHMLARQDTSDDSTTTKSILLKSLLGMDVPLNCFSTRKMQSDLRLSLAKKLLAGIPRLLQSGVPELIKKPSILHDAAKVGNVELITILIRTYPDLILDTDDKGYTIFHIAVIHRQEKVFKLIQQIGAMTDFIVDSHDEEDNNILHLAAKLGPLNKGKIVSQSARQMHRELAWFKEVEAIVSPSCLEIRNKKGLTPRELFSKHHKSLFEKSEAWMRKTADSCMLIATIIFTVVFAAAFTPPGGNNSETGIPILLKKTPTLFAFFVIFEGIALFGSIFSVTMFWSIVTSTFEEDQFLEILPFQLKLGLSGLLVSLIGACSAFISAYFLVFVDKSARLVSSFIALAYFLLVFVICFKIASVWAGITSHPGRVSLFKILLDQIKEKNPGVVYSTLVGIYKYFRSGKEPGF